MISTFLSTVKPIQRLWVNNSPQRSPNTGCKESEPSVKLTYCSTWFNEPRKRYSVTRRFEKIALRLLPQEGGPAIEETMENKSIAQPTIEFNKFWSPEYLAAKKVVEAVQAYKEASANGVSRKDLKNKRQDMLKTFA